jgi:hypothetical protein
MKRYVFGLVIATVLSAAALAGVLLFLNPFTTGWVGLALLATSAYFLLASLTTLVGFTIRVVKGRGEVIYAHLGTAFRQGLLLSLVVVGSLLLQAYRIFNIWSALLFIAAVVLVELAVQSHTSGISLRESARLPGRPTGTLPAGPQTKPLADVRVKKIDELARTRFSTTK